MGKVFVQDKDKLLELADSIASGKERSAHDKIKKTKSVASSSQTKKKSSNHSKSREPPAKERIVRVFTVAIIVRALLDPPLLIALHTFQRAAKELIVARTAKHKREKARARKAEGQPAQERSVSASGGDGNALITQASTSTPTAKRKRVMFA